MGREVVSDTEFLMKACPLLLSDTVPTLEELAEATGLSRGGVEGKLKKLNIRLEKRYIIPTDIARKVRN